MHARYTERNDPELEAELLMALRYLTNMPQREIARRLGVSQMTISRGIDRSLDRLRAHASR